MMHTYNQLAACCSFILLLCITGFQLTAHWTQEQWHTNTTTRPQNPNWTLGTHSNNTRLTPPTGYTIQLRHHGPHPLGHYQHSLNDPQHLNTSHTYFCLQDNPTTGTDISHWPSSPYDAFIPPTKTLHTVVPNGLQDGSLLQSTSQSQNCLSQGLLCKLAQFYRQQCPTNQINTLKHIRYITPKLTTNYTTPPSTSLPLMIPHPTQPPLSLHEGTQLRRPHVRQHINSSQLVQPLPISLNQLEYCPLQTSANMSNNIQPQRPSYRRRSTNAMHTASRLGLASQNDATAMATTSSGQPNAPPEDHLPHPSHNPDRAHLPTTQPSKTIMAIQHADSNRAAFTHGFIPQHFLTDFFTTDDDRDRPFDFWGETDGAPAHAKTRAAIKALIRTKQLTLVPDTAPIYTTIELNDRDTEGYYVLLNNKVTSRTPTLLILASAPTALAPHLSLATRETDGYPALVTDISPGHQHDREDILIEILTKFKGQLTQQGQSSRISGPKIKPFPLSRTATIYFLSLELKTTALLPSNRHFLLLQDGVTLKDPTLTEFDISLATQAADECTVICDRIPPAPAAFYRFLLPSHHAPSHDMVTDDPSSSQPATQGPSLGLAGAIGIRIPATRKTMKPSSRLFITFSNRTAAIAACLHPILTPSTHKLHPHLLIEDPDAERPVSFCKRCHSSAHNETDCSLPDPTLATHAGNLLSLLQGRKGPWTAPTINQEKNNIIANFTYIPNNPAAIQAASKHGLHLHENIEFRSISNTNPTPDRPFPSPSATSASSTEEQGGQKGPYRPHTTIFNKTTPYHPQQDSNHEPPSSHTLQSLSDRSTQTASSINRNFDRVRAQLYKQQDSIADNTLQLSQHITDQTTFTAETITNVDELYKRMAAAEHRIFNAEQRLKAAERKNTILQDTLTSLHPGGPSTQHDIDDAAMDIANDDYQPTSTPKRAATDSPEPELRRGGYRPSPAPQTPPHTSQNEPEEEALLTFEDEETNA